MQPEVFAHLIENTKAIKLCTRLQQEGAGNLYFSSYFFKWNEYFILYFKDFPEILIEQMFHHFFYHIKSI